MAFLLFDKKASTYFVVGNYVGKDFDWIESYMLLALVFSNAHFSIELSVVIHVGLLSA